MDPDESTQNGSADASGSPEESPFDGQSPEPAEESPASGESTEADADPSTDAQAPESPEESTSDGGDSTASAEESPADGQAPESPEESTSDGGDSTGTADESPTDAQSPEAPEESATDAGDSTASAGESPGDGQSPETAEEPEAAASSQPDPQDASNLDAASADAANFSSQPVGETVTPCPASEATPADSPPTAPGVNPPPPPVPGNLEVTVTDSKTNKPIPGAQVTATGPEPQSGTTDGSGKVKFSGIKTGDYAIKAAADGHTTENGSATVKPADTAKAPIPLTPITVTITLAQPVGCPGHPLAITAVGDPPGGTFAWTIAGAGVDLVDGSGAPVRTGPAVNLRGFATDDATGNIVAQTGTVTVTYTFTNGQTATATKDVPIHEIKFVVTNKSIAKGFTDALESAAGVKLWANATMMSTDPRVEIRLDASCPRKAACASNHQVGWLQTMLTNNRNARYSHTTMDVVVPMPIRDVWNATVFPFYSTVTAFTNDKDKQTAHHEDSPSFPANPAPWTDPRAGVGPTPPPGPPPATNLQLRTMSFSHTFTAWLVVQNIEWAAHHLADSFAFPGHFDWSMQLNVAVDTTKSVGSRVTPKRNQATMPAEIAAGKGGSSPNLAAPIFNTLSILSVNPAPGI